ncbi:AraC family transcriptional regulator [Fontibacillus sp. BL9]|uniref:AraC family transcriptional regulator n=1 Tax=Fontibacillus sp. BL9 TaxID=3389971 RepID=UPI00397D4258
MDWEGYADFWNHALIKITEIRHSAVRPWGQETSLFPSSGYLLVVRGKGSMRLNKSNHGIDGFCLLHAGKGAFLSIEASDEEIEYYAIFYQGEIHAPTGKVKKLSPSKNPMKHNRVWIPEAPVVLFQIVRALYSDWNRGHVPALNQLYAKSRFYEFVYEHIRQLQLRESSSKPLDVAEQILHYIHKHYNEPISLEMLAKKWNYSMQYLSKQFRQSTGKSPIDYVIQVRIDKAKEMLSGTGASTQEIALAVGYTDVFYFNRVFKKQTGLTPGQYKTEVSAGRTDSDLTWTTFISSIGGMPLHRYINNDNHYQYSEKGDIYMFNGSRSTKLLTFMLCFTLLLTACSGGGAAENRNSAAKAAGQEVEATGQEAGGSQASNKASTRTVSTVMGEVEVPAEPKRVVADWYLGDILALDVMPVGVSKTLLDYGAFLKPLVSASVEDIGLDGQVSLEKVMTLSPDLIITWDQEAYENYSKIAPTVVFDSTQYKDIHEEITAMGEILNKQDKAKEWLADFDQRKEAARSKIDQVIPEGATFTIVDYVTVEKFAMVVGDLGERGGKAIYQILGLTPAPKVKSELIDKKESRVELSWETVGDYVGDYVIVLVNEGQEPPKLPSTWTSLPAVTNNRVYEIEMKKYFASDPMSALLQAEEIADKLAGDTKN